MWKFVLPGSSEIDWCETNYVQSTYVAEFYNTVSNVVYLTLPPLLIYLFSDYSKHVGAGINAVWILLMVVGVGSIYFHATLSFAGQLIDELAIAWVLLAGFAIWTPKEMIRVWPFKGSRKSYSYFMASIGLLAVVLALIKPVVNAFILISVSIPAIVLLFREMRNCRDRRAWRLSYVAAMWLVVAVAVWLSDRVNCSFWRSVDFPYLHSIWHILILLASYIACVVCAYLYAVREAGNLVPVIRFWPSDSFEHGVPYVHLQRPCAKPSP